MTCSFPTHCYSCSQLMLLDYSLSMLLIWSCAFSVCHPLSFLFSDLPVTSQSLKNSTLPLYPRSVMSLFICLTSNSLASQFPNHFIFDSLHLCFAVSSHSLGHANVYCLMLIKTLTTGCSLCMLSYLLSLISYVFTCFWEVSCCPCNCLPVSAL